jgi:hypothetical protein
MSKRSREESRSQALEGDNGLLPIQDLLSPDEQDSATPAANKKPRNFIATVVCKPFPGLIDGDSNLKRPARLAA